MFRWVLSLGRKFLKIVPLSSILICLVTLISQISLVLAFFTPLKVLILLGSDSIPSYFPSGFQTLDQQTLVIGLSIAAVGCYFVHIALEKINNVLIAGNAVKILAHSKKLSLFSDQEGLAIRSYKRFMISFSGLAFVAVSVCLGLLIYPESILVIVAYVCLCVAMVLVFVKQKSNPTVTPMSILKANQGMFSACGFFAAFVFMVVDFIRPPSPSVIHAMLGLLLARQILNRLLDAFSGFSTLYAQKSQINSIFFHALHEQKRGPLDHAQFGAFVNHDVREKVIIDVFENVSDETPDVSKIEWFQTGFNDVLGFRVPLVGRGIKTEGNNNRSASNTFLLKIFNHSKRAFFTNESELLKGKNKEFPAFELVSTASADGYETILYAQPLSYRDANARNIRSIQMQFRKQLLVLDVDENTIDKYRRSKRLFFEYLGEPFAERLRLVCNSPEQTSNLVAFLSSVEQLQDALATLPLRYINPDASVNTLKLTETGTVVCSSWGRWGIEPMGAGWPTEAKSLRILEQYLESSVNINEKIRSKVDANLIVLSALTFYFQTMVGKGNYLTAIDLLPDINARYLEYVKVNRLALNSA